MSFDFSTGSWDTNQCRDMTGFLEKDAGKKIESFPATGRQ
jgi:hypothetical protein